MSDNPLTSENAASIVERAKAIIMRPNAEWPRIAAEGKSPTQILIQYAIPLALIGPVCNLLGHLLFGYGALAYSIRPSFGLVLSMAIVAFLMSLVSLYIVSYVASFLAAKFGGREGFPGAFKLVAYSMTPSWLAGVFGLIPQLAILSLLGLYSIYLFYVGATPVMDVPKDKAGGYTAVTIIVAIVLMMILNLIAASIVTYPTTAALYSA